MADGVRVTVDLARFKAELNKAAAAIEKKVARRAVRAAGAKFVDAAKTAAPVLRKADTRRKDPRLPGTLRDAIRFLPRRGGRGLVAGNVTVIATKAQVAKGRNPFYWRFLEGGWIPRGPGQKLRGGSRRRALERRRLTAAGARKVQYPFLATAFRRAGSAALAAFQRVFNEGMDEINKTS